MTEDGALALVPGWVAGAEAERLSWVWTQLHGGGQQVDSEIAPTCSFSPGVWENLKMAPISAVLSKDSLCPALRGQGICPELQERW